MSINIEGWTKAEAVGVLLDSLKQTGVDVERLLDKDINDKFVEKFGQTISPVTLNQAKRAYLHEVRTGTWVPPARRSTTKPASTNGPKRLSAEPMETATPAPTVESSSLTTEDFIKAMKMARSLVETVGAEGARKLLLEVS